LTKKGVIFLEKRKDVVCIRLTDDLISKLDFIADKKDLSRSQLIRQIVRNFVDMHI